MSHQDSPDKNPTNINQKITDLNENIQWFYSDDFSLDLAEKKYQDAISLANEIEKDLTNLKNRVEILSQNFTQ